MAIYNYACNNEKCEKKDVSVEVWKPMSECSREEFCECCGEKMEKTIESYICQASINKCGGFYRNVN